MTPASRAILTRLGLSQAEFAAETGVSPDTVSRWGRVSTDARRPGVVEEPPWVGLLLEAWERWANGG